MAKALLKKREPHLDSCFLKNPNSPKAKEHTRPFCDCGENPLDEDDWRRMHIPKPLWSATFDGVTEDAKDSICKFAFRIQEVRKKSISLYISGPKGVGKSGAATMILKEARAWGFTAFSISVTQLREAIRSHTAFDNESTVMDRARNVDFLLLDDLRAEDATEKLFSINDIRNLIVNRYDRGFPTIITSVLGPMEWGIAPCINDAIQKCCATLDIQGPDRHEAEQDTKNEFLK